MFREQVIACHHCDLLMTPPQIKEGECALCPRCNHKITRWHQNAINSLLSFAVTGLILLFLTTQFNLMTFNLSGNISQIDLYNSALNLYFDDYKTLAILVLFFIFLLPVIILSLIVLFILSIKTGAGCWAQTSMLRLIFLLIPWAMVEVFLVAILVSLVKLVTIAKMDLGWSFWAYVIFCFCYAKVLSLVDRYQFWHWINEAHR
jgi:paraquat-inducible protein A